MERDKDEAKQVMTRLKQISKNKYRDELKLEDVLQKDKTAGGGLVYQFSLYTKEAGHES